MTHSTSRRGGDSTVTILVLIFVGILVIGGATTFFMMKRARAARIERAEADRTMAERNEARLRMALEAADALIEKTATRPSSPLSEAEWIQREALEQARAFYRAALSEQGQGPESEELRQRLEAIENRLDPRVATDDTLDSVEQDLRDAAHGFALRSEEAARAVRVLRDAALGGQRTLEALKTDPLYAPIRDREDFRALLSELERDR